MSDAARAVLLMDPALSSASLQEELTRQALAWAKDLGTEPRRAAGPLSDDVERTFRERPGPLLVIWPCLPRLRAEHGQGALHDLEAGADIVLGPLIDGGLYLLGLSKPLPEVVRHIEASADGEPASVIAGAAASEYGLEIGLLRPERGLRSAGDVKAALGDPLTPPRIREILTAAA